MITLLAALAGGVGAAVRFVVDGAARSRWGSRLPVGTTIINTSGSLALGAITGLVLFHGAPPASAVIAGTGFLGGYTTFSTASFEVVRLLQERRARAAVGHLLANLAGSLVLAGAALAVAAL